MIDEDYINRALVLAERGRGLTTPNPMVGAVVVDADGVVVGHGYHERAGGPHAEVHALGAAGARARGATLYCTLEPCCHRGRTGPCVARVLDAGIRRVVASSEDPNPQVAGRGFAQLRAAGVEVVVGVGRARAAALNAPFFTATLRRRPWTIMKIATSLDGRIAAAPGWRTPLTSERALRHAHGMRAWIDAVGVGAGTILADDPLLTARGPYRARPLTRVIFDRRLETPPAARVLATRAAGPVIVLTTESAVAERRARARALEAAGARVEPAHDGTLKSALERLVSFDVLSLLLEGGSVIHHAAWAEAVVDRVQVYIAPKVLGANGFPWLERSRFSLTALAGVTTTVLGPDILIEGDTRQCSQG